MILFVIALLHPLCVQLIYSYTIFYESPPNLVTDLIVIWVSQSGVEFFRLYWYFKRVWTLSRHVVYRYFTNVARITTAGSSGFIWLQTLLAMQVLAFLMSFCIVSLLVNMCVCHLYNKLTYLLTYLYYYYSITTTTTIIIPNYDDAYHYR